MQHNRKDADECWLRFRKIGDETLRREYSTWCAYAIVQGQSAVLTTAKHELAAAIESMLGRKPSFSQHAGGHRCLLIGSVGASSLVDQLLDADTARSLPEAGYVIRTAIVAEAPCVVLAGKTDQGTLYAAYHFLRLLQTGKSLEALDIVERPPNSLRMINQWDNSDGSIERGYAGKSIFYQDGKIAADLSRVREYARLLASVGINAISINNVNVHDRETLMITDEVLPDVARIADVFRAYGICVFLSINYASPMQIGGLPTADPLDAEVQRWWTDRASVIYRHIPDFGGFLVKADSEFRPGPFTYGRNHAEGANMLADALKPHGGLVIWRCFVYNCLQDWRDRSTDRAKAAYDNFKPLDGKFRGNVILQIKNGPMDFQVREPVSPLFGAMPQTNQMLELQITQEYTGQQKHLCYLVPMWKEVLDFDTYAAETASTVADIVSGSTFARPHGGFAAVSNIGDDANWTGHVLAQANLFGYGRLAFNPALSAEQIADEWIAMTFGRDPELARTISRMLLDSWPVYEKYTAPLGVGWMVNPGHHYGPNVDGYEYSKWGTYHFADCFGIGVDRTFRTGTGYTAQYRSPQAERFELPEQCPDELLLFFHHVPYTYRLKSGKTVIQHIYDSHFAGANQAEDFVAVWTTLQDKIEPERYHAVLERLREQQEHAGEWRDVINTYFFRKSGIKDEGGRTIY